MLLFLEYFSVQNLYKYEFSVITILLEFQEVYYS